MSHDHAVGPPRRQILIAFTGLLAVMALAALDQTIVATALPTIVGDLGGINDLSWVVTAYLLGSTATAPLWGKVGDLYGRKSVLQLSVVVFLIGSALSGAATGMPALIGFRALQGIGAGGLMALSMAVVGDLVPPRERGRYQGYIQAVFAIASVVGPLLGGVFTDDLSWRWAFYVNLPIGIAALVIIRMVIRTPGGRGGAVVDYGGAVLLLAGVSTLQLLTVWAGQRYPWGSTQIVGLAAASAVLLGLFVWRQARASEPILPLRLFRDRVFSVAVVALFTATCSLFAAVTFLPLYLQVVRGATATNSGLLLLPLMLGITVATTVSGRIITRTGRYKVFPVVGFALTAVALLLFSTLGPDTSWLVAVAIMVMMGLGFGCVTQVLVLAVQNAVDRRELGTATAAANFFRSLGGSVGVALFGAVLSAGLSYWLSRTLPPSAAGTPVGDLLETPARIAALPSAVRSGVALAVSRSLHDVFLVAAPIAAVGFVAVLFLKEYPLRSAQSGPPGGAPRPAGAAGPAPAGVSSSAGAAASAGDSGLSPDERVGDSTG